MCRKFTNGVNDTFVVLANDSEVSPFPLTIKLPCDLSAESGAKLSTLSLWHVCSTPERMERTFSLLAGDCVAKTHSKGAYQGGLVGCVIH
jgi:hypothetical protein